MKAVICAGAGTAAWPGACQRQQRVSSSPPRCPCHGMQADRHRHRLLIVQQQRGTAAPPCRAVTPRARPRPPDTQSRSRRCPAARPQPTPKAASSCPASHATAAAQQPEQRRSEHTIHVPRIVPEPDTNAPTVSSIQATTSPHRHAATRPAVRIGPPADLDDLRDQLADPSPASRTARWGAASGRYLRTRRLLARRTTGGPARPLNLPPVHHHHRRGQPALPAPTLRPAGRYPAAAHARLARLVAEFLDDRPAHRPRRSRRRPGRRLPSGHPVTARLRFSGPLTGPVTTPHSRRARRADGPARLRPLRRAGGDVGASSARSSARSTPAGSSACTSTR